MRKYLGPIVVIVIALIFIFGGAIVGLCTDWLWFKHLGYSAIFSTMLFTKIKLGLAAGLLFFAIIYGNLWHARRIAPPPSPMGLEQQLIQRLGMLAKRGIGLVIFLASIVISFMVGLEAATHWEQWLMYMHATPFGVNDPVFTKDIGFYVFSLPFIKYMYGWLFVALVASTIASVAIHYADEAIDVFGNRVQFAPGVKAHIGVLIALMFFLKAWGYRLNMYDLLTAHGDQFTGAGYTAMHAQIPAFYILMVAAIIGGILVLINIFRRGVGLAVVAFGGLIALSIVVGGIYPYIVQQYNVKPNQRERERLYISRAIKATKNAYGLAAVKSEPFAANSTLTAEQVQANSATIENIRLWDPVHLQKVYNQNQTIRQYYHFQDVDVDRYSLVDPKTGAQRYRQVWLSAREIDQDLLPESARTWVNTRLQYQYTHGSGFVMSPVNEVNEQGLPQFFVYDIPPITTVKLPISAPDVYFGELTNNYVIVKAGQGGASGVPLGGFLRKALFALQFSDINMLLSSDIKSNSRLLYDRNIDVRLRKLFPFLLLDSDPYLVVANGRMYWMRDAYTISDAYPYSRGTGDEYSNFNYIRNSVKLVINAQSGKVDAYMMDRPTKDPMIQTYAKIFPGTFKPISAMPSALRAHIRYPEDLFKYQTEVYTRYHYAAKSPLDFYENSDLWRIPLAADLTAQDAENAPLMEPYYITMRLPGGDREEFILMMPYIHAGQRKNMVAWMAARCDAPNYGQMVLYKFPENKNVYGPQQIAGRAGAEDTISSQLTLWNQENSSVGSGNLIVTPIESSLLYVMPVYIISKGTPIPELTRVIVAMGDQIAWAPTLNEAISQIVGAPVSGPAPMTTSGAPEEGKPTPSATGKAKITPQVQQLVDKAMTQYNTAQQAQRNGDWAEYGRQMKALDATLKELQSKAK